MKNAKRTAAAAVALIAAITASAATSRIQHVELYPSGAAVTREVIVEAASAKNTQVEVRDLPSSILGSSFQISPVTESKMRVGGFTFLPNENPVKPDDSRTAELREAVKQISKELNLIKQEQKGVSERINHYEQTAQSIRKSLEEDATAEGFALVREAWSAMEEVREAGQARLAELGDQEKQLGIDLQEAQKDLNELVNELARKSAVLRFDLSGDLSKGIRLLIRYQVREAGWSPVHEIRANPAEGKVVWIYKARIHQSSGENWDGVQASLNSASGLSAAGLPPLNPLFLSRIEPRAKGGYVAQSMNRAADEVFELSAFSVDAAPAAGAVPESTTTGFFIRLPEPLRLDTGKDPVVREAFTGVLKAEFWSEAVPELSTEAWLMAGLTNELGWPVLAGESYSYIDGQLVARRNIQGIAAGEETELALGRNEKISIERKERVKKESEGGLIDRTKRHEIKYDTIVENRMPVAHRIVLQDRFPIGRDNKIQVRIVSPKDVEPEEGTGIFKWERTLESGKTATLVTEYIVSYPADWTIYPPLK